MSGTLFVVATPIGNLEDITARALRVLREASIIAAEDTRRTAHLLARYGISTPTTSLHEHNEGLKIRAVLERLERGEQVALVSDAGTPTIADPGQQLIASALASGIRVEPIPGPNAAVAALAVSGFDSASFLFLGFPPTKSTARRAWFAKARSVGGTVVFYEAPHRIRRTLRDLVREVGPCEAMVCREMTKLHEELVKGQLNDAFIERVEERGEFTVVANLPDASDAAGEKEVDEAELCAEFGEITESGHFTRRSAISELARRHGVKPNLVYEIVERGKKSVE